MLHLRKPIPDSASMSDEQVLVVPARVAADIPHGTIADNRRLLHELVSQSQFMFRKSVESNRDWKQIVTYSAVVHGSQVIRYRRTARGGESRLFGWHSVGVGGHVSLCDQVKSEKLPSEFGAITYARDRELLEEVRPVAPTVVNMLGLLRDETEEVGQYHIGVLFEHVMSTPEFVPSDRFRHRQIELIPVSECADQILTFEPWSRVLLRYLVQRITSRGVD